MRKLIGTIAIIITLYLGFFGCEKYNVKPFIVNWFKSDSPAQVKEKASKILKTRLYDLKMQERDKELGDERRSKIGTGDRSEKIRTYNYPQNRVTDHRIGFTLNTLDRIMAGDIDKVIDALITEDQARKLRGE